MNWVYELMDKFGLKTPPPALVAEDNEEAAATWGDCPRCAGDLEASCSCLWRCRHYGCEGLQVDVLNGHGEHDIPSS